MSAIYRCVLCELHYCADCDGGQDTCGLDGCSLGPLCDDCAEEHEAEHEEEERA